MSIIDIVILVPFAFALYKGIKNGFVGQIAGISGIVEVCYVRADNCRLIIGISRNTYREVTLGKLSVILIDS